MKAAPFEYIRAESVDHALSALTEHGGDAKLLAGGQSLVPMMAMRLARPALLVDIHRLTEMQRIADGDEGVITGAAVRQCIAQSDQTLASRVPLVLQALHWVGHEQTRNRGTIGGSLVHADPSAELPLAAAVLDAALVLRTRRGERRIRASEFFLGPMVTATAEDECLIAIEWPSWTGGRVGSAFEEVAIRAGDFAMASAAAQVQVDAAGVCLRAALGVGGVDGVPLALPRLAERLIGKRLGADLLRATAADAAQACDPGSDFHASAEYRRHLVDVLIQRVLAQALATATSSAQS